MKLCSSDNHYTKAPQVYRLPHKTQFYLLLLVYIGVIQIFDLYICIYLLVLYMYYMYNSIILVRRIQGRKTETGKKAPLPKSANCPSPPPFQAISPIYCFFMNPLPKNGFFSEPTKFFNKLYLSLNNSDFSLFLCNNFNPPPSP